MAVESKDTHSMVPAPALDEVQLKREEEALHVAINAYAKAASARQVTERWLGTSAAVASSIVTLSIFASLSSSPSMWAKLAAGALSATAASLVAVEKFSGKASSTLILRRAGEFAKLWYKLKLDGDSALAIVCYQHAELIGTEPAIDEKFWTMAREQVASQAPGA